VSDQFSEAFKRAFGGGFIVGLMMFFTSLQVDVRTRDTFEDAAIAGAVALLGYVIARGGIEGWIDTNRQKNGDMIPADVTAVPGK
jgi:hypothetical protein